MKKAGIGLFVLFLIIHTSFLHAATTGKIMGKVYDAETNEPLPGTNILVEGTNLGASAGLEGEYYIINIPPGTYNILFRSMGYTTKKIENVRISVDVTRKISIGLSQTIIEGQEVTVIAERPLVQADLTSSSARVSSEQMEALHLESVGQVVNLQAGVVDGHFRGGRSGEVAYLVDGLAVNDVYSGAQMINLESNSVEEVEVISGTFNAEYGRVMSGIVNIVSKEPEQKFSGMISTYTGAYLSGRTIPLVVKSGNEGKRGNFTEEYVSLNSLASFGDVGDIQGTLSGPVYSNKLSFFSSFRYASNNGYMFGRRVFSPTDSSALSRYRENWNIVATGDGENIGLNSSKSFSAHGKLIAKPFNSHKITYEYILEDGESSKYEHKYKYNPDGRLNYFSNSSSHMLHYDYVINASAFINMKAASLSKEYSSYVYESPYDERYASREILSITSGYGFYMGGNDQRHNFRKTTTNIVKSDLTWQANNLNQIKCGVEGRSHQLDVENYIIQLSQLTDWKPKPVDKSSPNYTEFTKKPLELSAYIQDKIEWSYFIMNLGLRYDYFDPDGVYPSNLQKPGTSERIESSAKSQWSPRFGIALPVTEKSVLHLSYGLFFQIPSFEFLYDNPDFRIPLDSYVTIGNTNLEPQKTSTYEIGIQHELTKSMAVDMTVYYKDIRNLLGMEVYTLLPTLARYARYVNRDYGQTFGFTIAFEQRSQFLSTTVDYTYMVAEGNASDPKDVYLKSQTDPPTEITKQLIPLEWDRTHSLNFTATVQDKDRWSIGIVSKMGSGFPYTPETSGYYPSRENTERKPPFINFDLNCTWTFKFSKFKAIFFSKIYNLFDFDNQITIYTDSGKAGYSIDQKWLTDDLVTGVNTINDYYYHQDYYSAPRLVNVGFKFEF